MSLSKNYFFSLVMSSPGGPGMVNGYILPENALQRDYSCVVNFGVKLKIALTGVRSRVRESLAKQLTNTFNSILFTETYLFLCKKWFPTI